MKFQLTHSPDNTSMFQGLALNVFLCSSSPLVYRSFPFRKAIYCLNRLKAEPALTIQSPCPQGLRATASPQTAPDTPPPSAQDLQQKQANMPLVNSIMSESHIHHLGGIKAFVYNPKLSSLFVFNRLF